MLSIWPSLSLLTFFLVIFLECRAIGGRVTLPLGGFLMVFCYGSIGAPLIALLLQQIPMFPDTGAGTVGPLAWLVGPPIEELAKAVPVIVLAFLTRESRRLSIADLTLIGFASGAGFGFVEGNLNALVNGALPDLQHWAALGLQSQADQVFFAGHAVSTALVGLAAGIGLRFFPPNYAFAWIPAAFVILWASFDHGVYNWKVLLAGNSGPLPDAHFAVEFLHLLTLHGQLQTWLLPVGLVAAQLFEAYLCYKALGIRRDLLLALEWRPWVINEWLVALLRVPLGRAAFAQTLGYFRLRRAFYLAAFEARRDAKDPTLSRHARSLEDRLKRERSVLFDPPRGTWLLPFPVLKSYAAQWTWRMRWVLLFAVLLLFVFMLDPATLPEGLRQFLFGETFAIGVIASGLAFALWRIVQFARRPRPDPLAAEGAACTVYYTRALLLGCSLVCGLFPAVTLLLGWKALAPGAAFISGYLPAWIAQGGNLQTLLGLGAIGAAVAPDPRPAGEALRHEIAAGDERIRRLAWPITDKPAASERASSGTAMPVQLGAFLDIMAKLDAERDAQARRQLALDECARLAREYTLRDPAPAVQAVKDEFDRLAGEMLEAAAKELDAIAALEHAHGRAWTQIMQDLDAHDALRQTLTTPLRQVWQGQNEIAWALRVAEATDECLLPMQLTLLPELHALATTAQSAQVTRVESGIERIRAAASEYGEADPFAFAVATSLTDEDESPQRTELASAEVSAEAPKPFGQRPSPAIEAPADPTGEDIAPDAEPAEPAPSTVQPRGQYYQDALDQLVEATRRDQTYLDTIQQLEASDHSLRQPIEPKQAEPPPLDVSATEPVEAHPLQPASAANLPTAAPAVQHQGELEDLIDSIKRDSGYLAFVQDPPTTQAEEARDPTEAAESAGKTDDVRAGAEPVVASEDLGTTALTDLAEQSASHPPEPVAPAAVDSAADKSASVETAPQVADEPAPAPTPQEVHAEPIDELASPHEYVFSLTALLDDAETADPESPREKDAPAETAEQAQANEPGNRAAAVEAAGPAKEPETLGVAAERLVTPEVRSSLFARLFQTINRESTDAEPHEPEPIPAAPQQPRHLIPASIDVGADAPLPDKREPERSPAEITAPEPTWLADLASIHVAEPAAKLGDVSLAPLEWTVPSPPAEDLRPTDVTAPLETPPAETNADRQAESAIGDAQADQTAIVEPVSAPSVDAPAPIAAEAAASVDDRPANAPDAVAPAADGDEFSSKADRLTYLLAKLEDAMQAKSAAETIALEDSKTVPPEVTTVESEQTRTAEPAASSALPVETPAIAVEPPVAAVEAPAAAAAAHPSGARSGVSGMAHDDEAPAPAHLDPERMSYLLTKLFGAVKQEVPDQTPPPHAADEEPPQPAALDEQSTDGVLDLLSSADSGTMPEVVELRTAPALSPEPAEAPPSLQPAVEPSAVAKPKTKPRTTFGARSKAPSTEPIQIAEPKGPAQQPLPSAEAENPAPTPRPDWKLGSGKPARHREGQLVTKASAPAAQPDEDDATAPRVEAEGEASAKKGDTSFRVKLRGSGVLATVDSPPPAAPAAAKTPGKYYGPRYAKETENETEGPETVQPRNLADALAEFYAQTGEPQPPMHTTDRATLQRIIIGGRLEAPLRRGAPWSISGMSRRGDVVIRLKPGADQFVEFVPSKELFGQIPHYYPRGVGRGSYATHIPVAHLEYFDLNTRQWAPLERG